MQRARRLRLQIPRGAGTACRRRRSPAGRGDAREEEARKIAIKAAWVIVSADDVRERAAVLIDGSRVADVVPWEQIPAGSTWTVTGDSVLTNLYNAGTIADDAGKAVTIQTADGKVLVEGTSEYTVTVESYSDSADLSGASAATSFSDYAVEKPQELQ